LEYLFFGLLIATGRRWLLASGHCLLIAGLRCQATDFFIFIFMDQYFMYSIILLYAIACGRRPVTIDQKSETRNN